MGIGANTAIFSVVNAVLLRPLPFPNPEQLMTLWEIDQTRGQTQGTSSYPNFFDLRSQNHVFEHVVAYHNNDFIMTGRGEPARLQGAVVNADLFSLLGVAPVAGRGFLPDEDKPGGSRVVVLSQELFQKRFNADASLLNQSITLDGTSYTVVGVMPRGFQFPIQNDPLSLTTIAGDASGRANDQFPRRTFPGRDRRLKPGASAANRPVKQPQSPAGWSSNTLTPTRTRASGLSLP